MSLWLSGSKYTMCRTCLGFVQSAGATTVLTADWSVCWVYSAWSWKAAKHDKNNTEYLFVIYGTVIRRAKHLPNTLGFSIVIFPINEITRSISGGNNKFKNIDGSRIYASFN